MKKHKFRLKSDFTPKGDQTQAIKALVDGLKADQKHQVLLGATGTGKTFTVANVIAANQKPTLIIAHNKTLAAQLYSEFKNFFPDNAVHYFVSYFDYYQPEAYKPQTDSYVEKDSAINDEIERLRHGATAALMTRPDVIIIASVSCIFGLAGVDNYLSLSETIEVGQELNLAKLLSRLNVMQYRRDQVNFKRGSFHLNGDILEIFPADASNFYYRVDFFGDTIERIRKFDYLNRKALDDLETIRLFPANHYATPYERVRLAVTKIKKELGSRLDHFQNNNQLIEAQRLNQRVNFDVDNLTEMGYVKGIENYSLYLDGRRPGQPPATLIDYYPDDYLLIIDESHMTVPQIRGMYAGDRSRKQTLVDYGFRLPSALDNRPLTFDEFRQRSHQLIYVSATPSAYELDLTETVAEQIIRPTGLLDPVVECRPTSGQVEDLIEEVKQRVDKKQRVLITTLTKRMAEDLSDYLAKLGIRVQYLHSDVKTLERQQIIYELRSGKFDTLIGINLLREGLDLPEVSLVIILGADHEGFLRSETSLIQTIGRAARHVDGTVIMYADKKTDSMKKAIAKTNRRRKIQTEFNRKHKITPKTIVKKISRELPEAKTQKQANQRILKTIPESELSTVIEQMEDKMKLAAVNLEFEKAATIRDRITVLRQRLEK